MNGCLPDGDTNRSRAASRGRGALWVKVCGLRSAADIEAAVAAGVDAVGFVFHPPSPRNVEPDAARALGRQVPAGIARVAVFLHPTQAQLDAAIDALEPDYVQLDAADLAGGLRVPDGISVLPVLRSGTSRDRLDEAVRRYPRCLFESGRSGAGEQADWSVAAQLAALGGELILAGGLTQQNIAEAVHTVRPFGVDVSSGVEAERGVKDPRRIREFVVAARAAQAALDAAATSSNEAGRR